MLDIIYCCRFEQKGRRAVFVVLSAAAPRILQLRCTTAEGRNVSDPTVFWHDGDWRCSRPLPEREQERPRLSERLSPAPPQVRCLSCRRAGAACSFARAASTCNYNGPYVSWQSPPHAQAGTQWRRAPMMKEARVAGTSPTTRQRCRVPFSIRTSPGDSTTSAPSSSSSAMLPERRTPKSVVSVL